MRKLSKKWWDKLSFEEKFYWTFEANDLLAGDRTRHPNTLTGLEIEKVFTYFKKHQNKLE